jgi:DNA repair protein RadD
MSALRPLRPHQERAIEMLRRSLASGHKRPMMQAPTGFGKTLTAAWIVQRLLDRGKRIAFVVPRLDLGSGLIVHSQKMTAAAMQIAEK